MRMMGRERNNPKKERCLKCAAVLVLAALCCGACGGGEPEDGGLLIMEQESEQLRYDCGEASIGDVVLTKRIPCTYLQKEEQEVSFSVSGRQIAKVAVRPGDTVKKGQLLAELAEDDGAERIEELEYRIARNRLLLHMNLE